MIDEFIDKHSVKAYIDWISRSYSSFLVDININPINPVDFVVSFIDCAHPEKIITFAAIGKKVAGLDVVVSPKGKRFLLGAVRVKCRSYLCTQCGVKNEIDNVLKAGYSLCKIVLFPIMANSLARNVLYMPRYYGFFYSKEKVVFPLFEEVMRDMECCIDRLLSLCPEFVCYGSLH